MKGERERERERERESKTYPLFVYVKENISLYFVFIHFDEE